MGKNADSAVVFRAYEGLCGDGLGNYHTGMVSLLQASTSADGSTGKQGSKTQIPRRFSLLGVGLEACFFFLGGGPAVRWCFSRLSRFVRGSHAQQDCIILRCIWSNPER